MLNICFFLQIAIKNKALKWQNGYQRGYNKSKDDFQFDSNKDRLNTLQDNYYLTLVKLELFSNKRMNERNYIQTT